MVTELSCLSSRAFGGGSCAEGEFAALGLSAKGTLLEAIGE